VSLAFLKNTTFSLLSTKHVALRTNYNTEIIQHKHTKQSKLNQTRQTIEKCLFNILGLLRLCDKRDMSKGLACKLEVWEFGWQGQMIWENWTNQDMSDDSLCFTKAWIELGKAHVNWITQVSNSATTILLNKCDNNYS
jgi:hypothetical protein